MSLTDVRDWMNEFFGHDCIWYVKRLSGNDTLANGSHQAGPYIPRQVLFHVFPQIDNPDSKNPEIWFDCYIDSHSDHRQVRAIWYNNKLRGGTRNESRVTNFGGASSAILDPDSTGALAVFAFGVNNDTKAMTCHVWVCRNSLEEDTFEERFGSVEPGQWLIWTMDPRRLEELSRKEPKHRGSCFLAPDEFPKDWLARFPAPIEIFHKSLEFSAVTSTSLDTRLMNRRECEFQLFKSVEDAIELPKVRKGFDSIRNFLDLALTITNRRKIRTGLSLEWHIRAILNEENLTEDQQYSYQPESETGKRPDFLFPSESAYKNECFPSQKLLMLAVKTTCKERWHQILDEADRVPIKHLLTLQEGVSKREFQRMTDAGVQLVIPEPLKCEFDESIRPHLQSLESFVADVRLLSL